MLGHEDDEFLELIFVAYDVDWLGVCIGKASKNDMSVRSESKGTAMAADVVAGDTLDTGLVRVSSVTIYASTGLWAHYEHVSMRWFQSQRMWCRNCAMAQCFPTQ
jgi:hypothetical protein